ncbi:ABC transporter ATP-binding protein [Saxibacter everestensis]|uniref:ABC transporter ATP-binding protein n=1 Tax=Saxibacter everestensis TaxID=2909229 RepID=A0ABY8QYC5_9MICO|nr:ABC transporter ATP-binding protein [Brevibacteriaceae bacterium ZFBP1038]
MTALISASGLGVSIDGHVLLAPVSFDIDAGQVLAVTGSNGAGKTTLLRVLTGLSRPSEGTVTVAGNAPNERIPEFRGRLAALLGLPAFARNLTLREHMLLVAASWGQNFDVADERVDGLLHDFGIARLGARFPHELSSGQTQLFALALTLSRSFEVLLLDEPEQRLDSERLNMVSDLLRGLADNGTTIVMASHNQQLVDAVSDQVLSITEGVYGNRG